MAAAHWQERRAAAFRVRHGADGGEYGCADDMVQICRQFKTISCGFSFDDSVSMQTLSLYDMRLNNSTVWVN